MQNIIHNYKFILFSFLLIVGISFFFVSSTYAFNDFESYEVGANASSTGSICYQSYCQGTGEVIATTTSGSFKAFQMSTDGFGIVWEDTAIIDQFYLKTYYDNGYSQIQFYNKNDELITSITLHPLYAKFFYDSADFTSINLATTTANWNSIRFDYSGGTTINWTINGISTTTNSFADLSGETLGYVAFSGTHLGGYSLFIDGDFSAYEQAYSNAEVDIYDSSGDDDFEDIDIIVGAENFNYDKFVLCPYDDELTPTCKINFYYTYDDIGADVYLMEKDETQLVNYIDMWSDLEELPQLIGYLYPAIPSEATSTFYNIYVDRLDISASSTLYGEIEVKWISSTTYQAYLDMENASEEDSSSVFEIILSKLKNLFPLNIIYQIKEVFVKEALKTHTGINIDLNDIVLPEYSGITVSGTILSQDLVDSNLPLWQDKVVPAIKMFLWILAFIYIVLRIRSQLSPDDNI